MGRPHEFGLVFQLRRIGGNFLIAFACTSVRMEDKQALSPAIDEHRTLFGENILQQIGTDKGLALQSASPTKTSDNRSCPRIIWQKLAECLGY